MLNAVEVSVMLAFTVIGITSTAVVYADQPENFFGVDQSSGIEDGVTEKIPAWIKIVFGYYAQGQIDEATLLNALEYLIENQIISASAGIGDVQNRSESGKINDVQVESSNSRISDVGDFYITYMPNPNSYYVGDDTAIAWLKDIELLEYEVEFLNENFRLPHDIEIVAQECGFVNAFYDYDTLQIVICYELIDDIFETWYIFNEDASEPPIDYSYDVLNYIFYHEVAHAIIHVYDLPTTGLEENVADQFASLMLSHTYDAETEDYSLGQDMLYNVGTHYLYEDEYWNVICPESAETQYEEELCYGSYWDVHGLDIQRFYNISCYAYGADPEYNQDLIVDGWLPEDRAEGCEYEYYQIDYAWSYLLKDYTNGFFD